MLFLLLSFVMMIDLGHPHGRLLEPPSRNSAWRSGFPTRADFDDHHRNCGGFGRQWNQNDGRCGVCGDAFDQPQPRGGEGGGTYGRGVIVRTYSPGQEVTVSAEITGNHKGYFEYRLCPHNKPLEPVSQACLDQHLLPVGTGTKTKHFIGQGTRTFSTTVRLPSGLTCDQCVLQWRYISGNNYGQCSEGGGRVGCGPQEEFRACADVAIRIGGGQNETEANQVESEEDTWNQKTSYQQEIVESSEEAPKYYYEDRNTEVKRVDTATEDKVTDDSVWYTVTDDQAQDKVTDNNPENSVWTVWTDSKVTEDTPDSSVWYTVTGDKTPQTDAVVSYTEGSKVKYTKKNALNIKENGFNIKGNGFTYDFAWLDTPRK